MISNNNNMSILNMSYHNLDILIKNLDIFHQKYVIIKSIKINQKRGVYLVYNNFEKKYRVLKFIIRTCITNEQYEVFYFFMNCQHPNFCKIDELFISGIFLILDMEYIEGDTLCNYFSRCHTRSEYYRIIFDLILSIEFIHSKKIVHCDIKPDNIIINTHGLPIIIDYDLSKIVPNTRFATKPFGTPFFMSPELMYQNYFTTKSDVWSLGMTFYVCIIKTYVPDLSESIIMDDTISTYVNNNLSLSKQIYANDLESLIRNITPTLNIHRNEICRSYGRLFMNLINVMLLIDDTTRPFMKDICDIIKKSKWFNIIYQDKNSLNKLRYGTLNPIGFKPASISKENEVIEHNNV
jgi:serine/threonine protein kinase